MVIRVLSLLSPLAAVALCLAPAASSARSATASPSNPVIDADFPDPAVLKAPDGFYYAYATQTERDGKWINLQVARSKDLKRWRLLGDALPAKPVWASKTQDFWAPHVLRDGGRYYMYYSAKPDTADERHGLCLAVATPRHSPWRSSDVSGLAEKYMMNLAPLRTTCGAQKSCVLLAQPGFTGRASPSKRQ